VADDKGIKKISLAWCNSRAMKLGVEEKRNGEIFIYFVKKGKFSGYIQKTGI